MKQGRREFLKSMLAGAVSASAWSCASWSSGRSAPVSPRTRRPNVVLILADDMGYGDLGCHRNPVLKTPVLDRLHDGGLCFTRFYTEPICAPTRACLLTGRYNYRAGVWDVGVPGAEMAPDEVTLAEAFAAGGYRTGMFGKWHLGDRAPLRPMDQGFEESLTFNDGLLGETRESYAQPKLYENGQLKQFRTYCNDLFFDRGIDFIERHRREPYFLYLPTNLPHWPYHAPAEDAAPYRGAGLPGEAPNIYGMIANIDRNTGRVMAALERLGLAENTIVIFLTDNGAQIRKGDERYNAGERGQKGEVYEGGIRVPCFVHWPAGLKRRGETDRLAAAIDLMPTLLDLCGVARPRGIGLDGVSLAPMLRGERDNARARLIFIQAILNGGVPQMYHNFAAIGPRYKLLCTDCNWGRPHPAEHVFELYDLRADPGESRNIAAQNPEVVMEMKTAYEQWFRDTSSTRGFGSSLGAAA